VEDASKNYFLSALTPPLTFSQVSLTVTVGQIKFSGKKGTKALKESIAHNFKGKKRCDRFSTYGRP